MASNDGKNSSTQLLEELEALSQSMYQTHTSSTNRRTASLVLPRSSVTSTVSTDAPKDEGAARSQSRPRSRRMSLSPFRGRPKLDDGNENKEEQKQQQNVKKLEDKAAAEKKGIWNWKPLRALTHVGMQKLSCLFSVEVVTAQGLPASMNGLRLSICVRKKETKDGAVHTMPSRVVQGAADFEETLFLKCHVYCTPSAGGKQLKFEPRPFLIYLYAVDAEELDFGRSSVDLINLIQESVEKNAEGTRVRQWDTSFDLSGKAKGGELVLKLGFQIMEKEGGIDIYSTQPDQGIKSSSGKLKSLSSAFARKQSKTSFSVPSPRMTTRNEFWTPSRSATAPPDHLQGIDELNLDEEAAPVASSDQKLKEEESKAEDDILDFEVEDKGVEIQDETEDKGEEEEKSEDTVEVKSESSEVVKEVVHDPIHLKRLSELDSIAQQLKALESMMGDEKFSRIEEEDSESQKLDEDEETVTMEFLQMLENEETKKAKLNYTEIPHLHLEGSKEDNSKVYLPDLGKGLGCVVQTKNGGCLVSMNPLDTLMEKKDTPRLAMQISKPVVLTSKESVNGFELFQRMATVGFEDLSSQILSLMPMDELMGKTAEQIAFEGMASAIIQGRNKEGASSTAARTVAAVKTMGIAASTGRKERISTGIWNVEENPLTVEEILACSLQKIETMAVEALKIQADVAEEDAPFDVSPKDDEHDNPLAKVVPLEDWIKSYNPVDKSAITLAVVVQLRDPLRRYEAVGGPMIALVQATHADFNSSKHDEDKMYKVASLHVGGLKVRTGRNRNAWDNEKQRLTAIQWLVAYGIGKAPKKGKQVFVKGQDLLWSTSSRIVADMWLKATRNPDVKFAM
ncbi:protein PLASTID MOVEMENT IMPAIRED 1-like [Rutidosis leptorrhynchoides]|uniref:protein PLASTID MOVEMENT IMPAIRED 1-like n=1 Tax=Rutidosis leptorrhynchoides TaxID=125765 RepID=UPI003A996979